MRATPTQFYLTTSATPRRRIHGRCAIRPPQRHPPQRPKVRLISATHAPTPLRPPSSTPCSHAPIYCPPSGNPPPPNPRPLPIPPAATPPATTPKSTPNIGNTRTDAAATTVINTVLSRPETSLAQYEVLGEFGRDLTEMARDGNIQPTIGRNAELRRVMQVLGRRSKNNPILVGEPGIGKGAIIEGLARYFASAEVASSLRNKRLVQLDVAALVVCTSLRGQLEERIIKLISDVVSTQGDIM